MEYSYKPTTNGRAAMAACMALEKPFHITRVAFGSGRVDEDINLADVHQLLAYVSDGAVAECRHEMDRLYLTIQFANSEHKDVKTFLLSEFIVYIENPDTGEDTDFLYGSLGDYCQPVPAYNPSFPPSVFNFPLELILSDVINVECSAPVGLVTYMDLNAALERHNADPNAHGNGRHVIAVRERDPNKTDYGIPDNGGAVALRVEPYTGSAEVSVVLNGVEYDAENVRTNGADAPNGTLILERLEDGD